MTRVVSLLLFCAFGIAGLALVFWWLLSSGWEVDTRRDAPPERGTQVSGEPVPGDAVDGSDAPEAGARSDEVDRQKAAPEAPVLGGVTYAGRVTNLEGAPLAGVEVLVLARAVHYRRERKLEHATRTISAADGTFRLDTPHIGKVDIEAVLAGYCGRGEGVLERSGGATGLELVLQACAQVEGVVTSPGGEPLADASIRVTDVHWRGAGGWDRYDREATTDASGRYRLASVPTGQLSLRGRHVRYLDSQVDEQLEPGETRRVDFQLEEGLSITGRVVNEIGEPIGDCEIRVDSVPGAAQSIYRQGEGFPDGRFEARGLPRGRYTVIARHPEHYRLGPRAMSALPTYAAGTEGVELALQRGCAVSGRVVDPTGRPVPFARVSFRRDPEQTSARCDEEGAFHCGKVPAGARAHAQAEGFLDSETITLDVELGASLSDLVLELRAGATLAGTVVDEGGLPLAGARVTARPASQDRWTSDRQEGISSEDGRFELSGLPVEPQAVDVKLEGYLVAEPSSLQAVAPGTSDLTIRMKTGARLSGTVRGPDGEGVKARLELESEDRSLQRITGSSLDDGTYSLAGIEAGSWELTAEVEGEYPPTSRSVQLQSGEVRGGFDLELVGGAEIRGVVLDAAGEPAADLQVYALPAGKGGRVDAVTTGSDGRFVLPGLAPVPHEVMCMRVVGEGAILATASATPGEGDVVLRIGMQAALVGRVVDAAGEPVQEYVIGVRSSAAPPPRLAGMTQGYKALQIVRWEEEGRFRIDLAGRGARPTRVAVEAGDELVVELQGLEVLQVSMPEVQGDGDHDVGVLRLPQLAHVSGVVTGASGQPIAGAQVGVFQSEEDAARQLSNPHWRVPAASTDEHGSFRIEGLKAGAAAVGASGEGFAPSSVGVTIPQEGLDGVALSLLAAGSIRGTIEGGARGHAHASAEDEGGTRASTSIRRGAFHLAGLLPGRYNVSLSWDRVDVGGGASLYRATLTRSVDVRAGEETPLEFQESRMCDVSGSIRGYDELSSDAPDRLYLRGSEGTFLAVVGSSGDFELGHVLPGEYQVELGPLLEQQVTIPETPEHHLELALDSGVVRGIVRQEWEPAVGATVHLHNLRGKRTVSTGDDGRFRFAGVAGGTYELRATSGGARAPVVPVTLPGGPPEHHELGQLYRSLDEGAIEALPAAAEVALDLVPQANLVVQVTAAGAPVEGAFVIPATPGGHRVGTTVRTDAAGRAMLEGIAQGALRIHAYAEDLGQTYQSLYLTRESDSLAVALPEHHGAVRLLVRRGGSPVGQVMVQLRDATGPFAVQRTWTSGDRRGAALHPSVPTPPTGAVTLSGLRAGPLTVRLYPGAPGAHVDVQVVVPASGQVVEQEVDIP